jgi:CBS domain-containing protein
MQTSTGDVMPERKQKRTKRKNPPNDPRRHAEEDVRERHGTSPAQSTHRQSPTPPGQRTPPTASGLGPPTTDARPRAGDRRGGPRARVGAPLATPARPTGPTGSAGDAAAEVADPNFTAASLKAKDLPRAGDTRMDTGRNTLTPPISDEGGGEARDVADLMTRDVAVCSPKTELYYVARTMAERDVGAIPVVESTDSMKPVGVITDRDITVRVVAKRQDPASLRAADAMSTDLLIVKVDSSIDDCVNQMEKRQVRRAIVVDGNGRCCGIIAQADIARRGPTRETGDLVREISRPPGQGNWGR